MCAVLLRHDRLVDRRQDRMDPRCLSYVCASCRGDLTAGDLGAEFRRVCTDSRQAQRGDLFVALAGDQFDGHHFLKSAAEKGVAAVMAERAKMPADWDACPAVIVENTRRALGRLAACYRSDFALPVVAVGGSNGKTTTKELIAAVLRTRLRTLWSESSFNNDVGVPLTLLRLESHHEAAVLEVGTNHPGELAPLIRMVRPSHGVLTSIGREHLEFFGSLDGVIEEEGWLAELLPVNGKLFVNGDCAELPKILCRTSAQIVRVGWSPGNHWRAQHMAMDEEGLRFEVDAPDAAYRGEYQLQLLGRHQVVNAMLAMAVGYEFGLSRQEIAMGLQQCQPPKMRLHLQNFQGVQVLDDSYNANADSVRASLQTLAEFPCQSRRVAVLGDMAELGPYAVESHTEVGREAANRGVDKLCAVGKMAPVIGGAAREAGLAEVQEFSTAETAAAFLRDFLQPGDVVLIKASRAMRLERITEALKGPIGAAHT